MDINGFTPDQIAKARECKNSDELMALVETEGIELTDEQLEKLSGGAVWDSNQGNCPAGEDHWWYKTGRTKSNADGPGLLYEYRCDRCQNTCWK